MVDYAMFSDRGNLAVATIVDNARKNNLSWGKVEIALYDLAEIDEYSEATDTAVREAVYIALGFDK